MPEPDFVHLHVHSEYSLLDGANRISKLVDACLADGQRALALTDHGNLFGAIEHYQACRAKGVQPIVGCEVYIAERSRRLPHSKHDNPYSHLTLLARTDEGYRNLLRLASASYLEGYHVRPRIDRELLAQHARGISCLSGCLSSELAQLQRRGREADALRVAVELRDLFGPEHFWLELQRNGIAIQQSYNEALHRVHERTGIPLVATNDIHYLRHEDCAVQDVLLCINTNAKRSDERRFRMDTNTLFFRTRAEMAHEFRDLPGALRATLDVADQVAVEIEFGRYRVPVFTPDDGSDRDALFDRLLEEGLLRKYGADHARARERLESEKRVIRELGFVSYFLIVWDLIRWARANGIPVGPGRGSAAGAIVAYLLDITKVDPLAYDLLFERFLNRERLSMPDIDIDFCKEGRDRVIQYTRQRYGDDYVAQIVTFGTMASRTVVRDVGRVLDVPLREIDRVAKKIPAGPGAPPLRKALEEDEDLAQIRRDSPELAELFELSVELEGQVRHISTHAAGIVIADAPITTYVPLCTQGEDVSTQWPAGQLEELGLLKMDYLGLRTLTILQRALEYIRDGGAEPPDLDALPPGDPATYRMLMAGDTLGVFQLESEGMRKLLARLKPDKFEDLIAVLALYRPGPLESGMDEMFIRRKHGLEPIEYPHPALAGLLADTYGCLVYQEQVMLISNVLADFSLNEADNLRKAMGKKKPEIMEKFSAKFVAGSVKNGCPERVAREIWDNIVKFGGYGFNKSHSTAYAMLTYQTAYLKANHRVAFLAANMTCEMSDSDKIKAFADDCKRAGVALRVPDARCSRWEFVPEVAPSVPQGGAIRFGLGAIKGIGQRQALAIEGARDRLVGEGRSPTLHALAGEVDPTEGNRVGWEALVKAGAFDWTGKDRGVLLAALDGALAAGAEAARDRKSGQMSMLDAFGADEPGRAPRVESFDESRAQDPTERLRAEREVLGFYLSGHPLAANAGLLRLLGNTDSRAIADLPGGAEVVMSGLVVGLAATVVKTGRYAGQKMARFLLEDLDGSVPVTVFPRAYEAVKEALLDDAIVVVKGKIEEREDSCALLLDDLLTVERAIARFEGALIARVGPPDEPRLDALRRTLAARSGSSPVYLEVEGADGRRRRVRCASDLSVDVSADLIREIDALLGPGRVSLARH